MSDQLRIIDLEKMQEEAFRRGFEAAKAAALEFVQFQCELYVRSDPRIVVIMAQLRERIQRLKPEES